MKKIIDIIRQKWLVREEVRYIIIGGLTTLVNYGLFGLMCEIMKIDYTVSNVTSISVSILFAYVTNKLYVFKRRCDTVAELGKEFVKFVGSRLFTMAIEIGGVWLFVEALHVDAMLGKAVSIVVVVILNYFISKLIVFRKTSTPSSQRQEPGNPSS